jgi:hypothetical protein
MNEDWDSVTKIGSKVRGKGTPRATVARTQSEINAARRSGAIVATDKKVWYSNRTNIFLTSRILFLTSPFSTLREIRYKRQMVKDSPK